LAALSPRATIAATTQCGKRHSTSRRELGQLCKTNGAKPGRNCGQDLAPFRFGEITQQ
jgi:hypothetical protein